MRLWCRSADRDVISTRCDQAANASAMMMRWRQVMEFERVARCAAACLVTRRHNARDRLHVSKNSIFFTWISAFFFIISTSFVLQLLSRAQTVRQPDMTSPILLLIIFCPNSFASRACLRALFHPLKANPICVFSPNANASGNATRVSVRLRAHETDADVAQQRK